MRKWVKICLFIALVSSTFSCTRKINEEKSHIRMQLPQFSEAISQSVGSYSTEQWNTSLNPTSVTAINCYGVAVGGPNFDANNCSQTSGTTSTVMMRFGVMNGFFPAGTLIDIEVPSGPSRHVFLIGGVAQNGACHLLSGGPPDFANMSYPYILAEKVLDLVPGDVHIDMLRILDTTRYFDTCNFIHGGGETSGPLIYGEGKDGDVNLLTSGGSVDVTAGTYVDSVSATRYINHYRRVAGITNTATGSDVTIGGSPPTSQEIVAGDDVMWIVMAARNTDSVPTTGPTEECGIGLRPGMWGILKVTSISGTVVSLGGIIAPAIGPGSSFTNDATNGANQFCAMQVVRIPSFKTLTLSPTAAAYLYSPPFTYWNGTTGGIGGIVALRANFAVVLGGMNSFTLTSDGGGFAGSATGNFQGTSVYSVGAYNLNANNVSGGGAGGSANGGGGGGNRGIGGNGAGTFATTGVGGINLDCGGGPGTCPPDKVFHLGGGGGGTSSGGAGGSGGGVVVLMGRQIVKPNPTDTVTLSLQANGAGGSSGGGGGAGGTVLLMSHGMDTNVSGRISAIANGGSGGGGTNGGGGGGGGGVAVKYCPMNGAVTYATISAMGSAGGTGGTPSAGSGTSYSPIYPSCNDP